jgi:hypothetical protein
LRVEALPFVSPSESADDLWNRFRANDFRGSICGAHGSGKTTLAETLLRRAKKEGLSVRTLTGSRNKKQTVWNCTGPDDADLLFIDGADLLPYFRRMRMIAADRILVTSHSRISGIPLLVRTQSTLEILDALIEQLAPQIPVNLRHELFVRHSGNIREIFRSLYDQVGRL